MAKANKFGALSGVFTPSILTILGVIMYLRLPWIVGQAGLWATIGIILVAHIISFTTSLSVSSIATDKKVETGGSYYIISRTLGLPIGGTLGLALFVGLSFSISLYLIGFAEVFLGYSGFEVTINNIRITGSIVLLLLAILTFISTSLAIKSQYLILTALVLSLGSIFFGSYEYDYSQPLIAPMRDSLPWIALFAIFFPAVTGFEAGVSMSGDLKDPRKNIPAGTIGAVLTGLLVYLGLAFFFAYSVSRQALVNDPSVLFNIAWVPQLVLAGILGATLSSALGSILGAPRILQATAIDKITPSFLAKGFGASNEPRNALLFTFFIALSGILIGELNVIARIVTIFFIITYGFLNITYAIESWAGTDFRPTFKIPGVISIIGALACIIVMIQLDVIAMIGASLVLAGLFLFLKRRELTLQTGDTWNSVWSSLVKTGLGKLTRSNLKPRNWRPNIILFSGGAKQRPYLIETGKALVGKLGIFTNFDLVESKEERTLFSKNKQIVSDEANDGNGVFTRRHVCRDIYEGIESIAKIYGFSGFEPNTVLMGWPRKSKKPEKFLQLVKTLGKLDYNKVFLHYDKAFGFGQKRQIDVWWSGAGRNLSFVLALLRFVSSSHEWRTARLRILMVSEDSSLSEKYHELLEQVLDNNRIRARVEIINNSVEKLPLTEIMRSHSIETDLSIVETDSSQEDFLEATNLMLDSLPTSLVVEASSSFDEIAIISKTVDDKIPADQESEKPTFQVVSQLQLTDREIVANEIYNVAQKLEQITARYYRQCFESILAKNSIYQEDLMALVNKTSKHLYSASKTHSETEMRGAFLKILNDFSFQSQKLLKSIKQDLLVHHKQTLETQTQRYHDELEKAIRELPPHIRVKYNWKEFKLLKADSFITGVFKLWKLLAARLTGRPATYRINVSRAARYYLYHKRIVQLNRVLKEFAFHAFEEIINLRKVLAQLNELIEKGKSIKASQQKLSNIFQMEKERFEARLSLQQDRNTQFYYQLGTNLEKELLFDLQNFSHLLGRPGSNFLSKSFPKASNNDKQLVEDLWGFAQTWYTNTHLFVNKIYLDFLLQSLKNRIEAKIRKSHFDLHTLVAASLLEPLSKAVQQLKDFAENGNVGEKLDKERFKPVVVENHYRKLFEEINALFAELPVVLSIGGEDLSRNLEEGVFAEATEVVVSVRKTVEFSIAAELIDYAKKQGMEASVALAKTVNSIKDLVRLINFNFYDESDNHRQDMLQQQQLALDFVQKLNLEADSIASTIQNFEASFDAGLKNTFAPLSSSIIAKTSGSIEKKFRVSESRKIRERITRWRNKMAENLQEQFVKLVYSKSEGVLWMGRLDKSDVQEELNNEDVYAYLDQFAPRRQTLEKLPFYYNKLFSGQSGIGEDFWVGMEDEVSRAKTALHRFTNGRAGCLLVSGGRNSGKTSLSKYVVRNYFMPGQVHVIRAPRECNANLLLFEQSLLKAIGSGRKDIETALHALPEPAVFIINDLELWWERKEGGTVVIERLLYLVKQFPGKVLFVVNINSWALELLNQLAGLQSWSLGHVVCSGFDAKELHDLVMTRHQAGGMKFILNKKHENDFSAWDFARLFNRLFDLSRGNPGVAINLWLASIRKISGKTLYMVKPQRSSTAFLDKLNRDQVFILLQFVYHIRLSAGKMAEIIQGEEEVTRNELLNLWQSGILVEKFPGIYAINPVLHEPIINKITSMKLL